MLPDVKIESITIYIIYNFDYPTHFRLVIFKLLYLFN